MLIWGSCRLQLSFFGGWWVRWFAQLFSCPTQLQCCGCVVLSLGLWQYLRNESSDLIAGQMSTLTFVIPGGNVPMFLSAMGLGSLPCNKRCFMLLMFWHTQLHKTEGISICHILIPTSPLIWIKQCIKTCKGHQYSTALNHRAVFQSNIIIQHNTLDYPVLRSSVMSDEG